MFEAIPRGDWQTLFAQSIVSFKGKFVFVHSTGDEWLMEGLKDGKPFREPNPTAHITPPYRRLGMVNTPYGAVYAQRKPARMYIVGYSDANITVGNVSVHDGAMEAVREVRRMRGLPLHLCLSNEYLTLKDAFETAQALRFPVAFDKQFAVDYRGYVYFKTTKVGAVSGDPLKVVLKDEFKELIFALDRNHEKDLRTVR